MIEPTTSKQSLVDPLWKTSMHLEFDALVKKNTWTLVQALWNIKIIDARWIFKLKKLPNGQLDKRKSRLVAKGYDQRHGFDFTEKFSLVVKQVTIRVILTIALSKKWNLHQLDTNNGFLNGNL